MQFFPIQMSVLLHAETDFLRLGEDLTAPERTTCTCVCAAGNGVSYLIGFVVPDGLKPVTVP